MSNVPTLEEWIELNKYQELRAEIECHIRQYTKIDDVPRLSRLIFISLRQDNELNDRKFELQEARTEWKRQY